MSGGGGGKGCARSIRSSVARRARRARAAHDARIMHAAAAVDAEGELRDAVFAARLCFGRIALVAFEPGDQRGFPVRQRVGIVRGGAGRGRGRALGFLLGGARRAGKARLLARRLLSSAFPAVSAARTGKLGVFRRRRLDVFRLDRLLRLRLRLGLASVCCGPGGNSVGCVCGATGSGASSIVITGAFATRSASSLQCASSAAAPATWKHTTSAKQEPQRTASARRAPAHGATLAASSPTSATCR